MSINPSNISSLTSQTRNKIDDVELIALQLVTSAPRVVISSELDTTNLTSISVTIHLGRQTETAFTAGVNFRIEMSPAPSGTGNWHVITQFTSALGSSVASQAVGAAGAAAGQKVIPMTDTTGFSAGDMIFIQNATLANSEFHRISAVTTNTSITIEDNLQNSQPATSTVYDQAESYYALIDTSSIKRMRVVIDGSGAAQNFATHCDVVTGA